MLYIPLNPVFFLLLFYLWFLFYLKRLYPEKIIPEGEPDTPHTPKRVYPLPQKGTRYQIPRKSFTRKKLYPEKIKKLTPKNLSPKKTFPEKIFPPVSLKPLLPLFPCTPKESPRHFEKRFSLYPEEVQDLVEYSPKRDGKDKKTYESLFFTMRGKDTNPLLPLYPEGLQGTERML